MKPALLAKAGATLLLIGLVTAPTYAEAGSTDKTAPTANVAGSDEGLPAETAAEQIYDASGIEPYITTAEEIAQKGYSTEFLEGNSEIVRKAAIELGAADLENPPAGYMGHAVDAAELTLHVFWVGGQLPEAIDGPVRNADSRVTVVVHDAARDQTEVRAYIDEIGLRDVEGTQTVGWSIDGTQLTVIAAPESPATNPPANRGSNAIPVVSVVGEVSARGNRRVDDEPLRGGALIESYNGNDQSTCSTGFPLRRTAGGKTVYWMVTANHCRADSPGFPGYWAAMGGDPLYHGWQSSTVSMRARPYSEKDLMILRSNYNLSARIYRGNRSSSTTSLIVGPETSLSVGDFVRTGGANSGEHVNQVQQPTSGNEYCNCMSIVSRALVGESTGSALGDSGGPLFTVTGPTANDVEIAGMISSGLDDQWPCSASLNYPGVPCGDVTYSIPLGTIVNYLNAIYDGAGWSLAY